VTFESDDTINVALSRYRHLGKPLSCVTLTMGLINKTYRVTTDESVYILQEVSPIFDTSIHFDSEALCDWLEPRGMVVPRILKTSDGKLFCCVHGKIMRALRFIDGMAHHFIKSQAMARSAGQLLGSFHNSLLDFTYHYRSQRKHAGDYQFHINGLVNALKINRDHRYFLRAAPLGEKIQRMMNPLVSGLLTTKRHVHGDPKISNILFDKNYRALCLVDFDTLNDSGWSMELADALRSWCNPNPEDVVNAHCDLTIAEAALAGYGSVMKKVFSKKETRELLVHAQAIPLCLSARYLADTLNEKYFSFDCRRYQTASDHNWLRAQAMFNLHQQFVSNAKEMAQMIKDFLS
jgi:Ser/Thr protein kinase RdoA (MazF antagonist)